MPLCSRVGPEVRTQVSALPFLESLPFLEHLLAVNLGRIVGGPCGLSLASCFRSGLQVLSQKPINLVILDRGESLWAVQGFLALTAVL